LDNISTIFQKLNLKLRYTNILDITLVLAGLIAITGAILSLTGRTGGDQEAFMYAASRLLAGARPGLDLWEVKPPIHIYFLALGQLLFGGPSYLSTLAIDMILQITGASILAAGLSQRFGRRIGLLVALLYLVDYYVIINYWTRAQVEATANALMMAALGLLVFNGFPLWFLAGILFATAGVTKGLTFLFLLPFGILVLSLDKYFRSRRILSFSAGICAGLLAWVTLWALSGSLPGVINDFRDVTIFQNNGSIDIYRAITSSLGYVVTCVTWPMLLGMAFLAFVDWHAAFKSSRWWIIQSVLFFGGWLFASIGVVTLQRNYFSYHYLHLILGGALFAGISLALANKYPSSFSWWRCGIVIALSALMFGMAIAIPSLRGDFKRSALLSDTSHQMYWLAEALTGRISHEQYIQNVAIRSAYDENASIKAAEAVRNYSEQDDKVLYLEAGKIAWRADRESVSRYFIPLPVQRVLSGRSPQSVQTQAYRDLYSLIWNYDGPVIVLEPGWFALENDPALQDRIFSRYRVVEDIPSSTSFGGYDVLVPQSLGGENNDGPE
jgi:hypothetical protein